MDRATPAEAAPGPADAPRHLLAVIDAATGGDLRQALQPAQQAGEAGGDWREMAELGAAITVLVRSWQKSIREKESILAELQLSQAEVEEMNERMRGEIEERKRAEAQLRRCRPSWSAPRAPRA